MNYKYAYEENSEAWLQEIPLVSKKTFFEDFRDWASATGQISLS